MTVEMIAGIPVDMNEDGFLIDPNQWTEEVAVELARRERIVPLTDRHWTVIHFMREQFEAKGTGPNVRLLGKTSGIEEKELYQLFPKSPVKLAAKISGIPMPGTLSE